MNATFFCVLLSAGGLVSQSEHQSKFGIKVCSTESFDEALYLGSLMEPGLIQLSCPSDKAKLDIIDLNSSRHSSRPSQKNCIAFTSLTDEGRLNEAMASCIAVQRGTGATFDQAVRSVTKSLNDSCVPKY